MDHFGPARFPTVLRSVPISGVRNGGGGFVGFRGGGCEGKKENYYYGGSVFSTVGSFGSPSRSGPPATGLKAQIPQKCCGECREKVDCWGHCWEQCWEDGFVRKSRGTALFPAVPPAVPLFPALFPALSTALLGDLGFLSPVAGGPDLSIAVLSEPLSSQEREVLQYSSHCVAGRICIAMLLGKSWWLWSLECSPVRLHGCSKVL